MSIQFAFVLGVAFGVLLAAAIVHRLLGRAVL
jgi:hypothetical protein